jgi:hypothetical protein
MKPQPDPSYRHRFPAEIISHAIWLSHVFSLSLRDVELLLAERGVVVSSETVRRWCKKSAASFADRMRRRRPPPGDKWHMDGVFIRTPLTSAAAVGLENSKIFAAECWPGLKCDTNVTPSFGVRRKPQAVGSGLNF